VTSPEPLALRREHGFTLLEVMCAFAILGLLLGALTVTHTQALEQGRRALDLRELREAADTVFRRIVYEEHQWHDGDGKTLDQSYAEWAGLKGPLRDRWRFYRWELEKVRRTAAGPSSTQHDEEPITGGSGTTSGTSTSSSRNEQDKDGPAGQALWRMTMKIFYTDEAHGEPLLTLRTYLPVREDLTANAAGGPK
jgi:prepilin-type N-terminal cleavage/methylation domain-containing protein